MNQAAMKAFQGLAVASMAEVYGGGVVINGVPYQVAVDKTAMTVATEAGGSRRMRGLTVLIPKTMLVVEPKVGTVVLSGSERYALREVGGRAGHETAWRLVCTEEVR